MDWGPPAKLQTDNGLEFKNSKMIHMLENEFPGVSIERIFGNPRHPQSQGLVEQGNAVVCNRLAKVMPEGMHALHMKAYAVEQTLFSPQFIF